MKTRGENWKTILGEERIRLTLLEEGVVRGKKNMQKEIDDMQAGIATMQAGIATMEAGIVAMEGGHTIGVEYDELVLDGDETRAEFGELIPGNGSTKDASDYATCTFNKADIQPAPRTKTASASVEEASSAAVEQQ